MLDCSTCWQNLRTQYMLWHVKTFVTSFAERQSHLVLAGPQIVWAKVSIFFPENGEVGETSIRDRVEAQAVEEGTQ